MFRKRTLLALVLALTILPLMGCATRRTSNSPIVVAPPCNTCPQPGCPG